MWGMRVRGCLVSRLHLRHVQVGGLLGMFCPKVCRTSGSLGVLLGALACWLGIVLWFFCCLPCVCVLVGWCVAYVTSALVPRLLSGV